MGCSDDEMPGARRGTPCTQYMYVCHAELSAILNSAHNSLKGARVYVTLFPCSAPRPSSSPALPRWCITATSTTTDSASRHGSCSRGEA